MSLPRRLLTAGGLLLAGVVAGWAGHSASPARADVPHPGLQFSLGVVGVAGCDTTRGDAACRLDAGSRFTLNVRLDSLPNGVGQYQGFDLIIRHTGVTPQEDGSMEAWPDCGFPARFYGDGVFALGCAIGIPPAGPSTYTGVLGTNTFTCTRSGTISLLHGVGNTGLHETVAEFHAEGVDTTETLRIGCGAEPPPPGAEEEPGEGPGEQPGATAVPGPVATQTAVAAATATARATPARPLSTEELSATATAEALGVEGAGDEEDGDGGGPDAWIIALIVVGAVAAAGAAGFAGWRYYRRRQTQA